MMIGCQEEEAQNHHCEGMVCEGEVIMSWNGWYQREIILCCEPQRSNAGSKHIVDLQDICIRTSLLCAQKRI